MNHPLKPTPLKPERQRSWQEQGVCAQIDPDIHFPEKVRGESRKEQTALAIAICNTCPVIQQCRAYALNNREVYGIWGGLSENQLSLLARRPRQRSAA